MTDVLRLDEGLHTIDLGFQGLPGVIASYLIEDDGERALIETGPTSTLDTLLAGLAARGIDPESIGTLLVTHIHLDHSGAAGAWLRRFPRARLYAHEIGVPHLVDPAKLLSSATRIYGEMMEPLWGEVLPVPADQVTALTDGSEITIGRRKLTAIYTPGHASHHVAFHDGTRDTVFTGDIAAVRMQGMAYVRPPTPPPDLDLELWSNSIDRLRALSPRVLYLTHFGPFRDVDAHLDQTRERLYAWADIVRKAADSGQDRPEITDNLRLHGDGELLAETNDAAMVQRYELGTPYGMTVDGYLRYFRQQARATASR